MRGSAGWAPKMVLTRAHDHVTRAVRLLRNGQTADHMTRAEPCDLSQRWGGASERPVAAVRRRPHSAPSPPPSGPPRPVRCTAAPTCTCTKAAIDPPTRPARTHAHTES
eukprot:3992600-Prymnesium_polylepis.1